MFFFLGMDSISLQWILSLYNGFYRWWNALLSASCSSYDVFFVDSWPILQKSFAEPFEYSSLWKSIIIDCIRMSDMCGMWIWHTFYRWYMFQQLIRIINFAGKPKKNSHSFAIVLILVYYCCCCCHHRSNVFVFILI